MSLAVKVTFRFFKFPGELTGDLVTRSDDTFMTLIHRLIVYHTAPQLSYSVLHS